MAVDAPMHEAPSIRRDELALCDRLLKRFERLAIIGILVGLVLIGTALPYL